MIKKKINHILDASVSCSSKALFSVLNEKDYGSSTGVRFPSKIRLSEEDYERR